MCTVDVSGRLLLPRSRSSSVWLQSCCQSLSWCQVHTTCSLYLIWFPPLSVSWICRARVWCILAGGGVVEVWLCCLIKCISLNLCHHVTISHRSALLSLTLPSHVYCKQTHVISVHLWQHEISVSSLHCNITHACINLPKGCRMTNLLVLTRCILLRHIFGHNNIYCLRNDTQRTAVFPASQFSQSIWNVYEDLYVIFVYHRCSVSSGHDVCQFRYLTVVWLNWYCISCHS